MGPLGLETGHAQEHPENAEPRGTTGRYALAERMPGHMGYEQILHR